jgi:pimeloyl-ACP methyl ester carboxylesterase
MSHARSKDGTLIAYERTGSGPALILVDGALCSRRFGDTRPYAREREVEDLAALLHEAGGTGSLLGFSSGGALALEAAASGLPVRAVVAYEPPYVDVAALGGTSSRRLHTPFRTTRPS